MKLGELDILDLPLGLREGFQMKNHYHGRAARILIFGHHMKGLKSARQPDSSQGCHGLEEEKWNRDRGMLDLREHWGRLGFLQGGNKGRRDCLKTQGLFQRREQWNHRWFMRGGE